MQGSHPVDVTPMDLAHTEPVYDFAWLQSKTGTELMTVSTDGQVLWWDIRMFGEYVEKLKVRCCFCVLLTNSLFLYSCVET